MVLAKQQVAFVMQNHPAVRETPLEHWSLGAEKKVVGLENSVRGVKSVRVAVKSLSARASPPTVVQP